MKVKLLTALLVLMTVAAGQSSKGEWKEYAFPQDGFAITAPSKPEQHPDPQNPQVRIYSVSVDPATRFSIRTADWKIDCEAKRKQLKALARGKDIVLHGVPGLELRSPLAGDPTKMVIEQFFCLPNRVFTLSVGFPAKKPQPASVQQILHSFRFLEQP